MLRKHPYIFAITIATLLMTVVWLCVPKEYAAITKVSDEYKEMELAVGLDNIQAQIRKKMNLANTGINDMAIYCKLLGTDDFARHIAHVEVPDKNMTYGDWLMQNRKLSLLSENDTTAEVKEQIEYNYHSKYETLTIRFTDRDPLVASQMLDSVIVHLQNFLTSARQNLAKAMLEDARKKTESAEEELASIRKRYAQYCDTHVGMSYEHEKSEQARLEEELKQAVKHQQAAIESQVRQELLMKRTYCSFAVVKSNTVPQNPLGSFFLMLLGVWLFVLLFVKGCKLYFRRRNDKDAVIDYGNIFSPWAITIGIWCVIFICIYLMGDKLYPLTNQAYAGIALWVFPFCIFSFVTHQLCGKHSSGQEKNEFGYNKFIFFLLLLITLIMSPLYLKKVMDIINMFGTKDMMSNIRLLAVEGEGFGILDISFVINKALLIIALWNNRKGSWKITLVILLLVCMNSFAVMDKGSIFFVLSVLMFVLYEKGKIKFYHIGVAMSAIVVLFFVFTIFRSGTDDTGNNLLDDMTILDFIGMYILANPVAFGYLHPSVSLQAGSNTFFLIYYYLNRFGIGNFEVVNVVQEFISVPISTNQYTIVQPFFIDFGYSGILYFSILYGIVCGWAYNNYRNGSTVGKVIYTYFVYILVLQFGQEQVFLLPVPFMRIIFFLYILTQTKFKLRLGKQ